MLGPLRLQCGIVVDDAELSWRFSRSSGPGGQGVNTTDSRVELSWDVAGSPALDEARRARALAHLEGRLRHGVLTVTASEHRAQRRNREAALARLTALVDEALRPPAAPRRPARPSRASRTRRVTAERQRRDVKSLRRRPSGSSGD
ncbi:alternative ribosome rescue aminoacyl-tRNA hydrolase ArfB [Actinotalea sp. K2]|uniref:alternative ribosome rescue aminoacyl-tRNA hydrolase ArfB n=1 Tax=Actinotalea sp. K2 TaxID=2939438 RepID=UPI00201768A3|nr:alternative ribosome rescue aminoacyl-tRNA hydrolase ArfB [Actinotalea sp. K2]MCL3859948.1 aminoacyl-tRNA hydrolase [Actinotalea sp. K2]